MNRVSKSKIKLITLAYSILVVDIRQEREVLQIIDNIKNSFINFYSDIKLTICIQSSYELFEKISHKLEKFICKIPLDIQLIYGGLKGLSKSRNICIKSLNTKYIHFLDGDCRFSISDSKSFIFFLKSNKTNILFINSSKIEDNKKFH